MTTHDRSSPLSVLVVDDHEVVLWGFKLLLSRLSWVEHCLVAGDDEQAIELAARHRPDVAVVDLFLGESSGVELTRSLVRVSPETRVLLTSGAGWISPRAARAVGAAGFVAKGEPAGRIAAALHSVGAGGTAFSERPEAPATPLSPREREVLELVAGGATNREIGARLHLSPDTVKDHTSTLYRKLDVRNRAQAVARAQRLNLTD